ncbi:hypothetical protein [Streptomyces sp. NPDC058249]|uniref:hypothetical protein n=1 Tax=Streptomyces sp. NPDC058249 TaxID=3346403 RepID=UPI0036E06771
MSVVNLSLIRFDGHPRSGALPRKDVHQSGSSSPSNEHRIWRLRGDTPHVCFSRDQPHKYAEALAEITTNGELVPVMKYLARRRHQIDALAAEYRAVIDIR